MSAGGRRPRAAWRALLVLVWGGSLATTSSAGAFDVQLDSDTTFQVYEVRSVSARAFTARRRLLSRLSLRIAHDLEEPDDDGRVIRLTSEVQLRLEQEFGETCLLGRDFCVNATDSDDPGAWQPLAADTRLDVPAVWVQVDGLPLGLSARLGRQLVLDEIGFARVDGLRLRVAPLHWLSAEVVGGLLVRGTSLVGTPRSELVGAVRLDDQTADRVRWVDPGVDTWVVGAALEGGPGRWLQLRLALRHMWELDGDVMSRVSASASSQPVPWLRLDGGGVFDLMTEEIIKASGRVSVGDETLRVRAGVSRHVPRFDQGTIWAWFSAAPLDQAELGATWRASPDVSFGGALRGRRAELGEPYGDDLDAGVDGWFRARWEGFRFGASAFVWSGALGPLAGSQVDVTRRVFGWLELALNISVWHFDDPHRVENYGTVLSEVVSARFRASRETLILIDLQHATNRLVGHRFRGVLAVRVDTWR